MFGESSIYGKCIIHLDDRNRIILPKFTSAEKGDKLLLVRNKGYMSIHREDILDIKIRRLEELCLNSTGDIKIEREKELFAQPHDASGLNEKTSFVVILWARVVSSTWLASKGAERLYKKIRMYLGFMFHSFTHFALIRESSVSNFLISDLIALILV